MEETRELLMDDYNRISDILKVIAPDSPDRSGLERERDNIRKELIELDSVYMNAKMKEAEIKAENKREKVRNGITIGTFLIGTYVSVWAVIRTFEFDVDGTITSTLGRGILGSIVPKTKK